MNASNYVIAVPKGWDDLREKFNELIKEMQDDGTMKQLEEKWDLVEPPPGA
jgi:ABC-type amino acid transport substrate-binding protein